MQANGSKELHEAVWILNERPLINDRLAFDCELQSALGLEGKRYSNACECTMHMLL